MGEGWSDGISPRKIIVANLGVQAGSLSQERSCYEPETVRHRELILDYVGLLVAGMRVVPLVG